MYIVSVENTLHRGRADQDLDQDCLKAEVVAWRLAADDQVEIGSARTSGNHPTALLITTPYAAAFLGSWMYITK